MCHWPLSTNRVGLIFSGAWIWSDNFIAVCDLMSFNNMCLKCTSWPEVSARQNVIYCPKCKWLTLLRARLCSVNLIKAWKLDVDRRMSQSKLYLLRNINTFLIKKSFKFGSWRISIDINLSVLSGWWTMLLKTQTSYMSIHQLLANICWSGINLGLDGGVR